jgi:hypothetical protein
MKILYNVKKDWRDYEREAIHLFHRTHNYSDAVDVYFMECDQAEAQRVAKEFNDAQPLSPVAPVASIEEVPYGYFLIIREPYDD